MMKLLGCVIITTFLIAGCGRPADEPDSSKEGDETETVLDDAEPLIDETGNDFEPESVVTKPPVTNYDPEDDENATDGQADENEPNK